LHALQASSQQESSGNNKAASAQKRNFSASISAIVAEASFSSSQSGTSASSAVNGSALSKGGQDSRPELVSSSSRPAGNPTTSENTELISKGGEIERSAAVAASAASTSEEPFLGDLSRGAKVIRAGGPPLARQATATAPNQAADSWERSRISVRRTTTAAPLQAEGRGGRREDHIEEAAVTQPPPASQQQRGRVRLNASTLGLYQKNHPLPRASPLTAVRGGANESGGGQQGVRPGVGGAAIRADRVRFKVRWVNK